MAVTNSFPGPSGVTGTVDARKAFAGTLVQDSTGAPRGGVLRVVAAPLVWARADMKVDVLAFEGVSIRGGGPLFMSNDGTTQVTLDAAPAANSRIDVIYFKQNESTSPFSDANNLPVLAVLKGTAAASPTKPSIAGIPGASELATVLIPSTATATNSSGVVITQTYQFTCMAGGTIVFRTLTERDAFSPSRGQRCYVQANSTEYVAGTAGWESALGRTFNVKGVPPLNGVAQAAPPAGAVFRIQTHYVEATTSSGGVASFNWAEAVTGGIAHVSFTTLKGSASNPALDSGTISKTGARVIFPGTSAVLAGFTYQLVYWE